jgi:hypothetical protein
VQGGRKHLTRHEATSLHKKFVNSVKGTLSIEKCLVSEEKKRLERLVKEAQLKICVHLALAEHNLPFLYMEHGSKFCPHCFPDSNVAKELSCSRTKTTDIIKNVIGPYVRKNIASHLRESKFSIIIDETTDVSTKQSLVIAVRFFNDKLNKVNDCHFALVVVNSATANDIFLSIADVFKK